MCYSPFGLLSKKSHRLEGLSNRSFLTVLEAGSLRSQADRFVSGEGLIPDAGGCLLTVPHIVEVMGATFRVFYKSTNPIYRASSS